MNWEDDDVIEQSPATRANWVAPGPSPAPLVPIQRAATMGYMPSVNLPAPVVTVDDDGHYAVERAKGFAIRTSLLGGGFALSTATLTLIVLVGRTGAATTGLASLCVLFVTFAATWAWALSTEVKNSPGGIARRHADGLWEFVAREQEHLHDVERERWTR